MKSLPLIPMIFTCLSFEGMHIYIYIYSQHLAPDPRFDKVAIAKSALRRGRLIFVQAGMACDHLAKLAGSGWRDQTGNPTERMDEYE